MNSRLIQSDNWLGMAALLLAIVIFAAGAFIPLGIAAGIPYIAVVLLGGWWRWRHAVLFLATLTSVLTVLGYFISPSFATDPWVAITNRGLTLLAIWVTAVLVQRRTAAERALRKAHQSLEQTVEHRTAELAMANRDLRAEILRTQEAEGQLRASEDRYRQLVANVPSVIYQRVSRSDGSTYYPFVSDAVRNVYGVEPVDVTSDKLTLRDLVHPEDRARVEAVIAGANQAAEPWTMENRIVTPTGTVKWIRGSAKPRRLPNGDILWDGVINDITERRLAEEELRRSEERYAMAIRGANDGLWDWDITNKRVSRSARVLELFDLDPEKTESDNNWWLDQIHSDDLPRYREAIVNHLKGRTEFYECEYRVRARDGRYQWAHERGSAQRGADGRAYRMAGSIRNITERRAVVDALKQSEERFRALSDLAPTAVLITRRADGGILYANRAAARILGVTADHAVTSVSRLYADPAERIKVVTLLEQNGRIEDHELRMRRTDGRPIWVALNAELIEFDGQPAVFGAAVDISARKASADALRESEMWLRGIMDNVLEGILTASNEGIIRSINAAGARILGYSPDELVGRSATALLPEPHASRLNDYIEKFLMSGCGGGIERGLRESIGVRKDGTTIPVELSVSAMNLDAGGGLVFVAVFRDISGRKRTEAERAKLQAQMQETEKLRALGTLAGGIAHDINNTLVPMLNLTELAIADLPDGEPRENLETALAAGQRVRDMTRQILAFSRREKDDAGVVDLAAAVNQSVSLSRACFPPGIRVHKKIPPTAVPVAVDVTSIHQLMLNLISNAVDAMADGGALTFKVDVIGGSDDAADAPQAELIVSDTGHGMDAETAKRMFEPFYTTKPVGRGTGLGLSIVHGIVSRSGGTISVSSAPGLGTTFRIRFPLADGPEPRHPQPEPAATGIQ